MRMYYVFAGAYGIAQRMHTFSVAPTSMASTEIVSELCAIHIRPISGAHIRFFSCDIHRRLRTRAAPSTRHRLHSQPSRFTCAFISFFLLSPLSCYYNSEPRYSSPFCSDKCNDEEYALKIHTHTYPIAHGDIIPQTSMLEEIIAQIMAAISRSIIGLKLSPVALGTY